MVGPDQPDIGTRHKKPHQRSWLLCCHPADTTQVPMNSDRWVFFTVLQSVLQWNKQELKSTHSSFQHPLNKDLQPVAHSASLHWHSVMYQMYSDCDRYQNYIFNFSRINQWYIWLSASLLTVKQHNVTVLFLKRRQVCILYAVERMLTSGRMWEQWA